MSNQWRKILYEDQGFNDNYTDKTFLRDLKKNINIKEITLVQAAAGASLFVQQFCTAILFCSTYIYLYNGWIQPDDVFYYTSLITLCGFITYYMKNKRATSLREHVRTLIIYLIFGKLFSPVLYRLTDTISTDTIYTMAFLMMLVHLIFFDYGVDVAIVSNSLSSSAAMFAAICLASRLASPHHAFVLITVALECFVLFPTLRRNLQRNSSLTLSLVLCVILILYTISISTTVSFVCVLLFLNFFCPLLYVRYQKYKENLYGPWDEAIIENALNINDLIY